MKLSKSLCKLWTNRGQIVKTKKNVTNNKIHSTSHATDQFDTIAADTNTSILSEQGHMHAIQLNHRVYLLIKLSLTTVADRAISRKRETRDHDDWLHTVHFPFHTSCAEFWVDY